MPRGVHRLSDRAVRAFIGKASPGKKLFDGGGLHLAMNDAGTPIWRAKYAFTGKERVYTIGQYPGVTLAAARTELAWVKTQLREGRDPVQARRVQRATAEAGSANTFEAVALEWLEKRREGWSAIHYDKSKRALERDVFPALGRLPIAAIPPVLVSGVVEAIDKRGARDTAGKILQHINGIFRFAQARGLRSDNPADPVGEILSQRRDVTRRPALLAWKPLGAVLRAAELVRLSPAVRLAHRLCAFSVARISNIVEAEWPEFDLEALPAIWLIPRHKMKVKSTDRSEGHKIILGDTIAGELRAWRALSGGKGYVFASTAATSRHISREAIEKAYRVTLELDGQHTPHGWRSAFSTLARDQGFEREVVELTLDHIHDNDVARAYDRGERLQKRVELMTWWDQQLTQAERGGDVVALHRERSMTAPAG